MMQNFLSRSFNLGLLANVMSISALAFCGLTINILIIRFYGSEGLGLFNLVMALFIGFSQLSTFGLHYSILTFTAQNAHKAEEQKKILTSGIVLTVLFSLITSGVCFIFGFFIEKVFKFQSLSQAWFLTIPGLIFFSLNKSFLAFLNGQNRMLIFASLRSMRYITLLAALLFLISFDFPMFILVTIITLSEFVVCLMCVWILWNELIWPLNLSSWYKKHYTFGLKSFFAGASIELNSKVDVIVLSYFTNETLVGIYSLALFSIEGLCQFVVVLSNSLNPLITQHFYAKAYDQLENMIKKVCLYFLISMTFLFFISIFLYYFYASLVLQNHLFESMNVFLILLVGLLFSVYYLPLQFFPNQVGNPSHQSYLNFSILIGNLILSTIFIYFYGLYGAALATSLSFVLSAFIIRHYINVFLKEARGLQTTTSFSFKFTLY